MKNRFFGKLRMTGVAALLIMTMRSICAYGQGTKLSSFPPVTTDTGIYYVVVSDSGGVYKDKLLPLWIAVPELEAYLGHLGTFDYILSNGNLTGRTTMWSNGAGTYVQMDTLGGGIDMYYNTTYHAQYYGNTAILTNGGNEAQITPYGLDIGNTSDHHGIVYDTTMGLTNAGGDIWAGFSMNNNTGTLFLTDANTGLQVTQHVGPLTAPRDWWWRNRSDTIAGLGDIWNDTSTLVTKHWADSVINHVGDSVARACDSIATWKVDSAMATVSSGTFTPHPAGTPTIVAESALGTGTVVSVIIVGDDRSGYISVVAGTSPTSTGVLFKVTFNTAWSFTPNVFLLQLNPSLSTGNLLQVNGMNSWCSSTATYFEVSADGTALSSGITYSVLYMIFPALPDY